MSNPFDQFDAASGPATFTKPGSGITVEVGGDNGGAAPDASQPRGIRNNNPLNLKTQGTAGQDGPFAVYNTPEEGRAAADDNLVAYHQKHGINTISGVVGRWAPPSENDTPAYVAHVSQQLGLDPNAPLDMTDPAVRSKLLDAMQSHESPGSVPAQVAANPFDQFDAATGDAVTVPPEPTRPVIPHAPPGDAPAYDFAKSITDPITKPAEALARDFGRWKDAGSQPPVQRHGVARALDFIPGFSAQDKALGSMAGDVGAMVGGVFGGEALNAGVTEPLARAADLLPAPDKMTWNGKLPGMGGHYVPQMQSKADQHQMNVDSVNTALVGARPNAAGPFAPVQPERFGPRTTPAQLRAQADALYAEMRHRDIQLAPAAVDHLNQGVGDLLASEGAHLYPQHANWARQLAETLRTDPSFSGLDKLRSKMQQALTTPTAGTTPDQLRVGNAMIDEIDQFMGAVARHPAAMTTGSGDPARVGQLLTQARDTWRRMRNVETVENLAESAGIRNATTHMGGNAQNFTKQKLRDFIDPTKNKALAGLSPAELQQLRRAIMGTPTTETLKALGNLSPTKGLGMLINLMAGGLTAGKAPLILAPVGYGANIAGAAAQGAEINRLLRMLARGGALPAAPPPATVRLASPAGLVAAGAASQQLQPRPVQKVHGR